MPSKHLRGNATNASAEGNATNATTAGKGLGFRVQGFRGLGFRSSKKLGRLKGPLHKDSCLGLPPPAFITLMAMPRMGH